MADNNRNEGTGVGGVILNEDGEIACCFQEFWSDEMIENKKDSKGARFWQQDLYSRNGGSHHTISDRP